MVSSSNISSIYLIKLYTQKSQKRKKVKWCHIYLVLFLSHVTLTLLHDVDLSLLCYPECHFQRIGVPQRSWVSVETQD